MSEVLSEKIVLKKKKQVMGKMVGGCLEWMGYIP